MAKDAVSGFSAEELNAAWQVVYQQLENSARLIQPSDELSSHELANGVLVAKEDHNAAVATAMEAAWALTEKSRTGDQAAR